MILFGGEVMRVWGGFAKRWHANGEGFATMLLAGMMNLDYFFEHLGRV